MKLYNIPSELQHLNQWVCVQSDSKVPLDGKTGLPASSVNPDTWSDFETVSALVNPGVAGNVGFVFADNGIIGIDIDDGYDEDGFMSPLAAEIINRCKSYTEKSRSGRGFHILLRGDLPFKGKNNLAGVEIYNSSRYFIMTGDVLLYDTIVDNQNAIDYIVAKYFPNTRGEKEDSYYEGRIYSPVWELPENNRIKLRPVYPRIPDGSRNICLTSLAGMLHNIGYSKSQILDELKYANLSACEPPLHESELRSIVNSVTRYKR